MVVQLKLILTVHFNFNYPDWGKRDVGDDITNPEPTFVGQPIQKMLFFRNRIALLSAENIILSRVNDFYNFWVKTAMAISNADPIDLQSSSTFPTKTIMMLLRHLEV